MAKEFYLETRPRKKGAVFCVRFRNSDGSLTPARSTRVVDRGRKSDRDEAVRWAQRYLDSGQIVRREKMSFATFVAGFFDWEGDWAKEKRLRGRRISPEHVKRHAILCSLHLTPFFGKKRLQEIDEELIRKWQITMADKGLAGGSINRACTTLRAILKTAYRKKLLRAWPLIERVAERPIPHGAFTPPEIRAIFAEPWPDRRCYVANLLSAATGLRASEVVGLQEKHLHSDYLEVTQGYTPGEGLHLPKNGKTRIVPIPSRVYSELAGLLETNPWEPGPDRFIFYCTHPDIPMDQVHATEALYKRLRAIGISEAQRRERSLCFHSWRHTFNTILVNRRIPLQQVQGVIGHLSAAMTERYYHLQVEELEPIRTIQDALFAELESPVEGGHLRKS